MHGASSHVESAASNVTACPVTGLAGEDVKRAVGVLFAGGGLVGGGLVGGGLVGGGLVGGGLVGGGLVGGGFVGGGFVGGGAGGPAVQSLRPIGVPSLPVPGERMA